MKQMSEFQAELTAATLRAARRAASEFETEGVYSFALYTSGEYNYVTVSVSTLTGLRAVANRYMAEDGYKRKWRTMESAERELRWSPCDSPHHDVYTEEFDEVGSALRDLWEVADAGADEELDEFAESVHHAFVYALRAVRDAGVFEADVVLNVLKGDQTDEERVETSQMLNAPEVHEKYLQEISL